MSPELKKNLRAEVWGSDMDRYVLRHKVVEIDNVLVDIDAFFGTRAGCDLCGRCCTYGSTIPEETATKLEPHLNEIAQRYLPAERREKIGWTFSKAWDMKYTNITKIDKGMTACSFLYKKGDQYLCSIYSWAQDTNRDPADYWPFECFMYPMAVLQYEGILHPGKLLLTLRIPQTWHITKIYGFTRPLERSSLRRVLYELRTAIARRIASVITRRPRRSDLGDCYFDGLPHQKQPSYIYFSKQIRRQFGDDFYEKLSRLGQTLPRVMPTDTPAQERTPA